VEEYMKENVHISQSETTSRSMQMHLIAEGKNGSSEVVLNGKPAGKRYWIVINIYVDYACTKIIILV
jgi:hypothetical protein